MICFPVCVLSPGDVQKHDALKFQLLDLWGQICTVTLRDTQEVTFQSVSSVFCFVMLRLIKLERIRDNEKRHVVVVIGSDKFPKGKQKQKSKVQMWVWNENAAKVAIVKWQLKKWGDKELSLLKSSNRVFE